MGMLIEWIHWIEKVEGTGKRQIFFLKDGR